MILCVDDDSSIRDIEVYTLQQTGFEAKGLSCGEELFLELQKSLPQLIILDIMMTGKDGIQILKELKANPMYENIPIIMATAKGSEMDKIFGLDLGCDDYLVKPFSIMEMVSRVKAVLRRYPKNNSKKIILQDGNLILNKQEYAVFINDEKINLTAKEFALLEILLTTKRKVFAREELLSKIWGFEFVGETRTVDAHVTTLRKKLKEYGSKIKTHIGIGYSYGE
ncbi:MAG: response regulator transcription factor [Treponema sp.]|nr:response regulator transcription factor [Treponema sp.]